MAARRWLLIATSLLPLTTWTLAIAQTAARVWRIGLIHVGNDHMPPSYEPMRASMRALGYEEGRNIRYDFRNVADEVAALEAARAFVRERVDLIVAFDQEACSAAHMATTTLPIVVVHAADPIASGFGKSLARPGGNMTGFAGRAELPAKELEMLREIAPKLSRVLLLFDSRDAASLSLRRDARTAAGILGVTLVEREARDLPTLNTVFEKLKPGTAEAVLITSTSIRHRFQKPVLALATARAMVMVGSRQDMVEAGALFSYSYDLAKVGRLTASRYVDRILKGKKPADLPIEEMTEYQFVVNRGVAKRHGWTFPEAVLLRAHRIVE